MCSIFLWSLLTDIRETESRALFRVLMKNYRPTKVLNYITAPDTVIWSAMLATAAVPGIMNPVVLMQKLKNGQLVPWNWGSKFKDGSLR